MKSPVLLIAFNRLDQVERVFESIRLYQPDQLFLFADGWRSERIGEEEKCKRVRSWLLSQINWDCDLKTFFSDINLGCGKGPSSAITWFFKHVEYGIILEDDCVPHIDFFTYCTDLLPRYANHVDVFAINSSNFQNQKFGDGSFYFSMQNGPFCAWATWKRAWNHFDYTMRTYSRKKIQHSLKWYYHATRRERKWWLDIYDGVIQNRYNGSSWDYQFIFAIWENRGKSIVPNVNISTNIGFGPDATHTKESDSLTANCPMYNILPLTYPSIIKIQREADLYYHDYYYDTFVEHISFYTQVKRWVKKLIKKI